MHMKNWRLATGVLFLSMCGASARANFVNQVDNFSGTTLDASTWAGAPEASFSQNNALSFVSTFGSASYTTIHQTVAWGQSVTMMLELTSADAGFSLFLTDGSVIGSFSGFSSAFWSFDLETDTTSAGDRIVSGTGSNGSWGDTANGLFAFKPVINHEYGLRIDPLSTNSAQFTLLDSDGSTVLESHTYTTSFSSAIRNVPDFMHISLTGGDGTATVFSVTIPEPSVSIGVAGSLLLLPRRRRSILRVMC
jgi:hypothetical protein